MHSKESQFSSHSKESQFREDTASNKKAEKKDVVIGLDQAFVQNVFELHDKYLQYVSNALYIIPSFTRL